MPNLDEIYTYRQLRGLFSCCNIQKAFLLLQHCVARPVATGWPKRVTRSHWWTFDESVIATASKKRPILEMFFDFLERPRATPHTN